ncbi:MAG: 4-hydroxy-3-methylbut-2-enyl diphosphate reductase [Lentisphaeria bacterium]|nr:4-hydroxy-3-methylbut-2-enyl diphosphate reductase [Lentisphaeria bacterium]
MGIEIRLAEPRGFCAGVERALRKVDEALRTGPFPVYVLHEIVHNETVVEGLRKRGVIFIDDPAEAKSGTLIFSAHGVSRAVEEQSGRLGVKVVDATCPIVKSLHRRIEEFAAAGKTIVLFGRNGHREVEGLLGRVGTPVTVIESESGLEDFLKTADRSKSYACLSQTTLNAADVERMGARLKAALPDVTVASEVCHATRERQEAVKKLAETCSTILVVGSRRSSNARRLYETAQACGVRAHLLGDASEFEANWIDGASVVGITSGASTPEELVQELCHKIHRTQNKEEKR